MDRATHLVLLDPNARDPCLLFERHPRVSAQGRPNVCRDVLQIRGSPQVRGPYAAFDGIVDPLEALQTVPFNLVLPKLLIFPHVDLHIRRWSGESMRVGEVD